MTGCTSISDTTYPRGSTVSCDVCRKSSLEDDEYFFHCAECRYDKCMACSSGVSTTDQGKAVRIKNVSLAEAEAAQDGKYRTMCL